MQNKGSDIDFFTFLTDTYIFELNVRNTVNKYFVTFTLKYITN